MTFTILLFHLTVNDVCCKVKNRELKRTSVKVTSDNRLKVTLQSTDL